MESGPPVFQIERKALKASVTLHVSNEDQEAFLQSGSRAFTESLCKNLVLTVSPFLSLSLFHGSMSPWRVPAAVSSSLGECHSVFFFPSLPFSFHGSSHNSVRWRRVLTCYGGELRPPGACIMPAAACCSRATAGFAAGPVARGACRLPCKPSQRQTL